MTDGPIRVLIADDDPLVRSALSTILSSDERISVVATVDDGSKVVEAVNRHFPDIVLMDIRMPTMDGLTATELLWGNARIVNTPGISLFGRKARA